jgi:transposase
MHPKKNKAGRASVYDDALKIAAARDYLTSNLSLRQTAEKYKLKDGDVVRWFVKWYNTHHGSELSVSNSSPPAQNSSPPMEIKELEKQLANANLKIAALEIMIEIAEKDLEIDIRKKPGTKQ